MININSVLSNLIAVVVVILILSLIVQSVQAVVKKALKIKSRQIEDSLVDLFENALNKEPRDAGASWMARHIDSSPVLRMLFRRDHPVEKAADEVKRLFYSVKTQLCEVGRVAQSGKTMLDSLSKKDLVKVMDRVPASIIDPGFAAKLQAGCRELAALKNEIQTIDAGVIGDQAKTTFIKMQESLSPVLLDLEKVFDGDAVNPSTLIGDILKVRKVNYDEALGLIDQTIQQVRLDQAAIDDPGQKAALQSIVDALIKSRNALTQFRLELVAAIAPLRQKLSDAPSGVEHWYDTVMQSLDERYTRGMKTWALVIGFLVAVCLNADLLGIYKRVASSDVLRGQLLQVGQAQVDLAKERAAKTPQSPTNGAGAQNDNAKISDDLNNAKSDAQLYQTLGFQPTTWQNVKDEFRSLAPPLDSAWLDHRKEDVRTLAGWLFMAFLLSVGAPFWEDTLESLFGVKNLLNKKKNGQPPGSGDQTAA